MLAPKTIRCSAVVQGEAVVEQLGALLAPVAAPVAVRCGAEAVEAGKDIEGVGNCIVLARVLIDATRGYGRFTYHSVNSEQRPPVSKRSTKTLSYTRSTSPSALKYVLVPIATAALPSAAKHS